MKDFFFLKVWDKTWVRTIHSKIRYFLPVIKYLEQKEACVVGTCTVLYE